MNELSRIYVLYTDATPSPFKLACLVVWSAPRGYFMETSGQSIHSTQSRVPLGIHLVWESSIGCQS
jgi:hypothetical protein